MIPGRPGMKAHPIDAGEIHVPCEPALVGIIHVGRLKTSGELREWDDSPIKA